MNYTTFISMVCSFRTVFVISHSYVILGFLQNSMIKINQRFIFLSLQLTTINLELITKIVNAISPVSIALNYINYVC